MSYVAYFYNLPYTYIADHNSRCVVDAVKWLIVIVGYWWDTVMWFVGRWQLMTVHSVCHHHHHHQQQQQQQQPTCWVTAAGPASVPVHCTLTLVSGQLTVPHCVSIILLWPHYITDCPCPASKQLPTGSHHGPWRFSHYRHKNTPCLEKPDTMILQNNRLVISDVWRRWSLFSCCGRKVWCGPRTTFVNYLCSFRRNINIVASNS